MTPTIDPDLEALARALAAKNYGARADAKLTRRLCIVLVDALDRAHDLQLALRISQEDASVLAATFRRDDPARFDRLMREDFGPEPHGVDDPGPRPPDLEPWRTHDEAGIPLPPQWILPSAELPSALGLTEDEREQMGRWRDARDGPQPRPDGTCSADDPEPDLTDLVQPYRALADLHKGGPPLDADSWARTAYERGYRDAHDWVEPEHVVRQVLDRVKPVTPSDVDDCLPGEHDSPVVRGPSGDRWFREPATAFAPLTEEQRADARAFVQAMRTGKPWPPEEESVTVVADGEVIEWPDGTRVTVVSGEEWTDCDGRRFRVIDPVPRPPEPWPEEPASLVDRALDLVDRAAFGVLALLDKIRWPSK